MTENACLKKQFSLFYNLRSGTHSDNKLKYQKINENRNLGASRQQCAPSYSGFSHSYSVEAL